MNWQDIDDIVESLDDKYPSFDIMSVRYTLLKKMICDLEDFEGDENRCNEKILEAVQAEWISYRNEK